MKLSNNITLPLEERLELRGRRRCLEDEMD